MSDATISAGLSKEDIENCEKLIDNGFSNVDQYPDRFLKKTEVKSYLNSRRENLEKEHPLTYKKKLNRYNAVLDIVKDEDIKDLFKTMKTNEFVSLMKLFVDVVKDSNTMQGHLAAEKRINSNISFDPTDLIAAINHFSDKHSKR